MRTVKTIAKHFNISADTVRHYTKIGLLSPTRDDANGYRHYSIQDERRLRFLLSAKRLGFSLQDIRRIMEMANSGSAPCSLVRRLIDKHLYTKHQEILDAQILYDRMKQAAKLWAQLPDQEPSGHSICHLIEHWDKPMVIDGERCIDER